MNRIDRLFAITLMLQAKGRVRAKDLAARFEVSERTIYRDIAALSEGGVPVVSLPGEGYELMEGFFLPPLMFAPVEASALLLGAQMLTSYATGRLPASAQQALAKIAAVLPHELRLEMQRWGEIVQFVAPSQRFDLDHPLLATLQQAEVGAGLAPALRKIGRRPGGQVQDLPLQQLSNIPKFNDEETYRGKSTDC